MDRPSRRGVEHWAAETPDRTAIVDGGHALSWAEWNRKADSLARHLRSLGLASGDTIALRMGIRWEWLVCASAAAKTGCRILGVNWRLRPAEVGFMLKECNAAAILFDDADAAEIIAEARGAGIGALISVDADVAGIPRLAGLLCSDPLEAFVADGHAPIILYTSGTTGRPKGVQTITAADARAVAELPDYVRSVEDAVPRSADDVLLLTMPLHHGAGPALVRAAVRYGTRIVIQRRFDAAEVVELVRSHKVTYWSAVPTMLNRLAALPSGALAGADFSSLRAINVGAAPVPPTLKTWLIERCGDILHEGYGSTETSMVTHLSPRWQRLKPGSSGRAHTHVSILIKDARGSVLLPGNTGEIWVRTPATIRRYIGQAPLGPDHLDSDGHFRTGDVGYIDEGGFLFITDRLKDMIISGGVNIYPAEVEKTLMQNPAVFEAAVIGIPDDDFGERVHAICELKPGASLSEAEVLAGLRQRLSSYKVPRAVDFVAELPRNAMGKVVKTELREPFWAGRARRI